LITSPFVFIFNKSGEYILVICGSSTPLYLNTKLLISLYFITLSFIAVILLT